MEQVTTNAASLTVGIDLGDTWSHFCVLDTQGKVLKEGRLPTQLEKFREHFSRFSRSRIIFEVGTHSPWTQRLLEELGHEVIVANARRVKLISQNQKKCDQVDAQFLARLGRVDLELLSPIQHRSAQIQADRALLRSRDLLVQTRSKLINHVRGVVKSFGSRLPSCGTPGFVKQVRNSVPIELQSALQAIFLSLESLQGQIREMDLQIQRLVADRYPQVACLTQVKGVGILTALSFVLCLVHPDRFPRDRAVGSFTGLCPARSQSGEQNPQLGITRSGDSYLRRLLVNCAQHILGPYGLDSDLRRWGLKKAKTGGPIAKKKAVAGVARKLSVLLLSLWRSGEVYEPLRHARVRAEIAIPI